MTKTLEAKEFKFKSKQTGVLANADFRPNNMVKITTKDGDTVTMTKRFFEENFKKN